LIIEPTKIEVDNGGQDSSSAGNDGESGEGRDASFDVEMLLRLLPKLDYQALLQGCHQIRDFCNSSDEYNSIQIPELPAELPASLLKSTSTSADDDDAAAADTATADGDDSEEQRQLLLLRHLHFVVFHVHVVEGHLICPDTGRRFPIKDGIPNLILHEDEH